MLDLVAVGTKCGFGLKMKLDEMGLNHGFQDKVIKVSKDEWLRLATLHWTSSSST